MTHLIHYTLPESDVVVTAEYAWKQTGKTDGYYERIECSIGKSGEMVNPLRVLILVDSNGARFEQWSLAAILDRLADANHADWYAEDDAAMRIQEDRE